MRRALVLGGGGVTGVAWELGLLAGLVERGVPVTEADLVVGTSAGSVVGALVCSELPVQRFYEEQLAPPSSEVAARLGFATLARLVWAGGRTRDAARSRARIGAMALAARTPSEASRRAVIEARLPERSGRGGGCWSRRWTRRPVSSWCSTGTARCPWWTRWVRVARCPGCGRR